MEHSQSSPRKVQVETSHVWMYVGYGGVRAQTQAHQPVSWMTCPSCLRSLNMMNVAVSSAFVSNCAAFPPHERGVKMHVLQNCSPSPKTSYTYQVFSCTGYCSQHAYYALLLWPVHIGLNPRPLCLSVLPRGAACAISHAVTTVTVRTSAAHELWIL